MPDSYLQAFTKQPVPVVHAEDVRRVWSFLASHQGGATSSIDQKLLADSAT